MYKPLTLIEPVKAIRLGELFFPVDATFLDRDIDKRREIKYMEYIDNTKRVESFYFDNVKHEYTYNLTERYPLDYGRDYFDSALRYYLQWLES